MAKIDLDSLNIEQLAALRDDVTEKLLEKVAARQVELEAELERLSQYGKAVRKSPAIGPAAKIGKPTKTKAERIDDPTLESDDPTLESREAVAVAA
jgi:hypothetical protein